MVKGTEYVIDKLHDLLLSEYNNELAAIDPLLDHVPSENVVVGPRAKISSFPFITISGVSARVYEDQYADLGIHEHLIQVEPFMYSDEADLEGLERKTYRYVLAVQSLIHRCPELNDDSGSIIVAHWRGHQYFLREDRRRAYISSAVIVLSVRLVP
ncbi:MAG: hypothetical protein D6816_02885 [Bacteroidetes bacterium]|nr:MAG: hypothetical protein D6816_02885 [Bacteroidota bacterium]